MAGTESSTDYVQRMFDEFFPPMEIDFRFLNVPDFREGMHAETFDFQDNQLLSEKAIVMNHLEDIWIAGLGRFVILMIASGFSEQGAAIIFILAYNLKDPSNSQYIFDLPPEAINTGDVSYNELPAEVLLYSTRAHEPLPAIGNLAQEAGAYCYLAASLLRMFIKSEEDYVRAFNQITTGYAKFFGKPMPISPPQPSVAAIRTLSHFFTQMMIYKASLFRILYCSGNTKRAAGMRRFLYENYLENTGMHAVSIFAKLCTKLNCRAAVLLAAMKSGQYHRQIRALRNMAELETRDDENHSRKMWRFGRIFDKSFMAPLQTKARPAFTYILASALKQEDPQSNQNILNIVHFAGISAERKRRLDAIGKAFVTEIRKLPMQ